MTRQGRACTWSGGECGARVSVLATKGRLVGFAYGATTFGGGEPEPWYARIAEALGPGVTDAALIGAFELVELGVVPSSRNRGIGGRLHDSLLAGATEGRAWLMTRSDATAACRFYRRRGWLELGSLTSLGLGRSDLVMTRRLPANIGRRLLLRAVLAARANRR